MRQLVFVFSFICYSTAWSQRVNEGYVSARAAGMGNAYSAVVDNIDAIFYNPAALIKSAGFHWTIFDINAGAGNLSAIQKLPNLSSDFANTINELNGQSFSMNGYGKTALQIGTVAMYIYENYNIGMTTTNPAAGPTFDVSYKNDIAYGLSFAFPIIPGIMAMGISTKYLRRNGNDFSILATDLATQTPAYLRSLWDYNGTGYGFDAGFLFKLPGPVSPTLSLAYKNIGGSAFKATPGSPGTPPSEPDELTAGFAVNMSLPLISFSPSIEIKHASQPEIPFSKKLHLGFELSLLNFDLRAGVNQGYWTAGLGIGFGFADIDLATYGVEVGAAAGTTEDRRYMLQLSMGLGFDAGGGGGDSGFSQEKTDKIRAQRRLKKRR